MWFSDRTQLLFDGSQALGLKKGHRLKWKVRFRWTFIVAMPTLRITSIWLSTLLLLSEGFLKVSHYLKASELSIGHWREQAVEADFLFLTNVLVNEALIMHEVLMSCKDTTEEYIFVEMKKWEPHDTHLRLLLPAGCFPAIVSGPYDSRWDVHESTNGLSALVTTWPVPRQLPGRRLEPEVSGRRCAVPGFHLPGREGRLHELPSRLLPAKLCLPVLKCQPPGW